jgi:hypothetical protein
MEKNGSFGFAKGWFVCREKPNVPFVQLVKITCLFNLPFIGTRESLRLFVLKKCGEAKNKKHRVGNECRLTRCPFVVSFLCLWSPVKMVYFFLFLSLVCLACLP